MLNWRATIACLDFNRLHLGKFILLEIRAMREEESSLLCIAIPDPVADGAGILDIGNRPDPTISRSARDVELALVHFAKGGLSRSGSRRRH